MLLYGVSDVFRATQMTQDKARSEETGTALFEGCNAGLDHLGGSLRASREAVVRCVPPLGKDSPFPPRRVSRTTASQLAEPITITMKEH